jgi:PAS domain S-box-containing protein
VPPESAVTAIADGRVRLLNAQAERLFEYGREELIGQPVDILVPEAVRAAHPQHRASYLRDPQPARWPPEWRWPDGARAAARSPGSPRSCRPHRTPS